RQLSGERRIVVVAPPVVQDDPAALRLAAIITGWLTEQGVPVFDPRREPGFGPAPLDAALRTPDGVHGTAAYGAMVIDRLLDAGLVAPRR
ncbi:MAG: hypothetical protein ACK4OP_17825, partial [Gemmobacter sp.]